MSRAAERIQEELEAFIGSRSARWLAKEVGVANTSASAWLKGTSTPDPSRFAVIEQALGMPDGTLARAYASTLETTVPERPDIVATGPDRAIWLIEAKGAQAAIDERGAEARLTAYARDRDLVIDGSSTGGAWRRYTVDQVDELVADIATDEIRPLLAAAADEVEGPATFFVLVTRRMDDIVAESKLATLRQWQEDRGLSIEDLDRLIEVLRLTGGKRPEE